MESLLSELQTVLVTVASAAITALCVYAINWLRTYLGIKESDSNEEAIRRAAETEAGKLLQTNAIGDPTALAEAVRKVVADLKPQVKAEGYDNVDIADMIIGAAGIVFPPANLLKLFIK
jgi:hypothetical protein